MNPPPPPAPYGALEPLSPLVGRVLAPNPSPFTLWGTGTLLVGRNSLAVIDPGPADPGHVEALLAAIGGRPVSHILVTHTHLDHSPAARALAERTGAPIWGCSALTAEAEGVRADAGFDLDHAPDHVLADGERVVGEGWTLEAIATPGHTSNHLSFALIEEETLFSGDHVMGWSTTVVAPPDGDMRSYMASLDRLLDREDRRYVPAHGPGVDDPRRLVRGLSTHRRQREAQIDQALGEGAQTIAGLVERFYQGTDRRLWPAAGLSVRAHLLALAADGRAEQGDDGRWHRL